MEQILIGELSTILVGRDLLRAEVVLGERRMAPPSAAVFSQPGASAIAGGLIRRLREYGLRAEARILPDGEAAKDLSVAVEAYRWLGDLGISRTDVVIAVGGGTVTDLAGFVAATWLRGIEVINVPTTVLGAVDAALGGKTGVNLDGKNLVGAFHHPSRVVADVDVLDRLPAELRRDGLAEALKCGLIADLDLLSLLELDGDAADLEEVVRRAASVKAAVVERDYCETGERAILNYGHTVGHAIEVACDLRHGQAIAIGMVAAGRVSALMCGFADEERQRDAIAGLGLPVEAPPADGARVRELVAVDKKRQASQLRMVLLAGLGDPRVMGVDATAVDSALAAVGVH